MRETNDIVIYCEKYQNIKINTRVKNPNNCQIVVMTNGQVRRLNRLENNILNPLKKTFFNRNRIDLDSYSVFFVKSNYFDGTWGGNVQYLDKRLDNVQEKVFIQAAYCYQIYNPEKAVLLIGNDNKEYDSKYFNIKLNTKIDNIIKKCIVSRLNRDGFIKTQDNTIEIAHEAEQIINEHVLSMFGISLANLNFELEESDDHYLLRKECEWGKLVTKGEKTNDIIQFKN